MLKKILKGIVTFILNIEARLILVKYKPKIIAVTGSVGKTGAKDAIYSIISTKFYAKKSEKSYNSDLGVPLAILGRESAWGNFIKWIRNIAEGALLIILKNHYPKWFVLELGTRKPGDIGRLAKWIKPDIAVITKLSKIPAHVEFFNTPNDVHKEKASLFDYLKDGGTIIVNSDDEYIKPFLNKLDSVNIITFGTSGGPDILGSNIKITYKTRNKIKVPKGISYKVKIAGKKIDVSMDNVISEGAMYATLAGIACSYSLEMSIDDIEKSLLQLDLPKGRGSLVEGTKESTIIDESYNASPDAMISSLFSLGSIRAHGRKIAVLGDMVELGNFTIEAHQEVGKVAQDKTDILCVVGPRAKFIADGAIENKMKKKDIYYYQSYEDATIDLKKKIKKGDVILVKGSQAMRMEKIVEKIMENPKDKRKFLVRQEAEWKER